MRVFNLGLVVIYPSLVVVIGRHCGLSTGRFDFSSLSVCGYYKLNCLVPYRSGWYSGTWIFRL